LNRAEAIQKFIRTNLRILLSGEPFPEDLYKHEKRHLFIEQLKNDVGVPKDSEIAHECLMFLFKANQINDEEKLNSTLSLPFFKEHVHDASLYEEHLRVNVLGKSSVAIDLKEVSKLAYRVSLEQQIQRKVEEEKAGEIQSAIEKKKEEYAALPSVLDQVEYEEPEVLRSAGGEEEYLPWWKRLGLIEDPFPSEEGLAKIAKELYEIVVYKADIIKRYLYYIQDAPSELFKNTVFFGEFGSGKTTFFEYLRMHSINAGIRGLYIQLHGEPDPHSLRMRFEKKLLDALCDLYESLKGTNPRTWASSKQPDEGIADLMKELKGDFIVFVDDLHKDRDNFAVAMKFVTMLQTFTADLMRAQTGLNVAFYFAGSPDWERAIKSDIARYSGSFSRQEAMPPLTAEAAKEMLDRRFEAFSLSPESRRTVEIDRIRQVYRSLQNDHLPITYRQFIHTVVSEFREGKFDVLTGNPVKISKDKLDEIRNLMESNIELKSDFDRLIYGGGIQKVENKRKCLELLVKVNTSNGITEESPLWKNNEFFFQKLSKSGLIQKLKLSERQFKWVLCRELRDKSKEIQQKFNLWLEDYLLQLYGGPVTRPSKGEVQNEEIEQIKSFLGSPSGTNEVKDFLNGSLQLHKQILDEQGKIPDKQVNHEELVKNCMSSLVFVTKAAMASQGIDFAAQQDQQILLWWKESWHPLDEVSEFLFVIRDRERKVEERTAYACSLYRQAYQEIFNFTREQCDKNRYFRIPPVNLTNYEIRELNEIRDQIANGDYYEAAEKITKMNERKLRAFLFNNFRLLYGEDMGTRLARVDKNTRKYILNNMSKDKELDFSVARNEFEHSNRSDYRQFIIPPGPEGIGSQNWSEVFSHVFSPLSEVDVVDWLDKFTDINIRIGHMKEGSITFEQQSRIFDYIRKSIEVIQKFNRAYCALMESGIYTGSDRGELFFSYCRLKDKQGLKPVFVNGQTASRLLSRLTSNATLEVNLEDWYHIEQYYSEPYPVFFAFLSRLIRQNTDDLLKTGLRLAIRQKRGCVVILSASRVRPIQTRDGLKLLSEEEMQEYLRNPT
jgi:hypothetical protein